MYLHRRLVKELPEVDLRVAYTHDVPDHSWDLDLSNDVNAITFGEKEPWRPKKPIKITVKELKRAGRVIRWLREQRVRVVILAGYSDAGRVRIIASCRRRGVPLFLHGDSNIHGDRFIGWKQRVKSVLVKNVVRMCKGVMPFAAAEVTTFSACSSVPVRKNTSRPISRWARAATSATSVV